MSFSSFCSFTGVDVQLPLSAYLGYDWRSIYSDYTLHKTQYCRNTSVQNSGSGYFDMAPQSSRRRVAAALRTPSPRQPLSPVSPGDKRVNFSGSDPGAVSQLEQCPLLTAVSWADGGKSVFALGHGVRYLATEDEWWLRNVRTYFGSLRTLMEHNIGMAFTNVDCDPRSHPSVVYTETHRWDGAEDYDATTRYDVDLQKMKLLLSGKASRTGGSFGPALAAEGQLLRCMLTCDNHEDRMLFLLMWMTLLSHMCGLSALSGIRVAYSGLMSVSFTAGCQPDANLPMMYSWLAYSKHMVELEKSWQQGLLGVHRVRQTYLGAWCYDHHFCALHNQRCAEMLEDASECELDVIWDETEPNTPVEPSEDEVAEFRRVSELE